MERGERSRGEGQDDGLSPRDTKQKIERAECKKQGNGGYQRNGALPLASELQLPKCKDLNLC